jgi:hypothetical protein
MFFDDPLSAVEAKDRKSMIWLSAQDLGAQL